MTAVELEELDMDEVDGNSLGTVGESCSFYVVAVPAIVFDTDPDL